MPSDLASTLERPTAVHEPRLAGVKTLLLHVQSDASLEHRLEAALSLARACGAHLTCLHVTPIQAYVAFDSMGGVFVMNDVIRTIEQEEAELRRKIESDLAGEDVSWDYTQVTGDISWQIVKHAALADLIVTGREPHRQDFAGPTLPLLGDLLHRTRTPLFVPGTKTATADPTGTAIIAWDGSYEAANAVRAAVGLLKLASDVRIVQVAEPDKDLLPSTRLCEYLSRHGIHADLRSEPPRGAKGEEIAPILLAHAEAAGAAYLVMGGYNHSRIGEYLFGGVTRTLLADCPVPLLIAH